MTTGGLGDWLQHDWPFGSLLPKPALQAFEALRKAPWVPGPDNWAIGPAGVIQSVAAAARNQLVDRPTTFRLGDSEIRMVLTELVVDPDPLGAAIGQFDDLRLAARDAEIDGARIDGLRIVARNVHLRPSPQVMLVAAPVELEATIDQRNLDGWFGDVSPPVHVQIDDDAVARVRLVSRPGLGHLEVDPQIQGDVLRLAPRSLVARGRRLDLVSRLPPLTVSLPRLPRGLRIVGLTVGPHEVRVRGVIDQWREPLSVSQLRDFLRRLRDRPDRLDVPRLSPDR
jgi:hypothetical protein